MGRSRGGLTTKLHCLTNDKGRPLKFQLTPGEKADCTNACSLLGGQKTKAVLADKGYDTDQIIRFIQHHMRAKVVIPPKCNRKVKRPYDKELYKERNLIERAFNKLKHWRRIATRYDRCDIIFRASISLACVSIWA